MQADRPDVQVYNEAVIRAALDLDAGVIDGIQQAFAALATRAVSMPPVAQIAASGGQTCVKGAWIDGWDVFAVKLSSIYPPPAGASTSEANGMMAVVEAATGRIRAVLLDNGYLTQLRTAAAGAVAARLLAPRHVQRLGLLGAGKQAFLQAVAARHVRPFTAVDIWARDAAAGERLARRLESVLPVSARVVATPRAAVADAQLVVTSTSARSPILLADDLHPGLHITAMGSDAAGKRELHPAVLASADLYVADVMQQCRQLGELQPTNGNASPVRRELELGELAAGLAAGRERDEEITICDLTGVGVQDTAIAALALGRLNEQSGRF